MESTTPSSCGEMRGCCSRQTFRKGKAAIEFIKNVKRLRLLIQLIMPMQEPKSGKVYLPPSIGEEKGGKSKHPITSMRGITGTRSTQFIGKTELDSEV